MSRRLIRIIAILIVLFSGFALTLAPAQAATTFDGTYRYSYAFKGPGGWETFNRANMIVQNGQISSDPPGLSGSVDDNGNVWFTAICPNGCVYQASFTGTLNSDGTGAGTYSCQFGHTGQWSVTIIQRPGLSPDGGDILGPDGGYILLPQIPYPVVDAIDGVFIFFYEFGGGDASQGIVVYAVMVGMVGAALGVAGTLIGRSRRAVLNRKSRLSPKLGYHRELGYGVSPAPPPQEVSSQEMPPPIGQPSGPWHHAEAIGEVRAGTPPLPAALTLHAIWQKGQVALNWDPLQFDHSKYVLDRYEVSIMRYDGTSTGPVKTLVGKLGPEAMQWGGPFNQTYRFSTGGDIEGYTVDAVFNEVAGKQTVRVGAMAYAPRP